jgi:hypothetical protein
MLVLKVLALTGQSLNDEPNSVYKVGFIREKGKATAKVLQWSPEARWLAVQVKAGVCNGHSNSGLGGFFLIGHGFVGFLR